MTLRRPALLLSIDGRDLSGPEAAAASVSVDLGLAPAHDRAQVVLHALSPVVDLTVGAQLTIGLGVDGDSVETVFTGIVERIQAAAAGIQVTAYAPSLALSRTRVAQAYLGQTAADVISDLLSQAGVSPGSISADLSLAAYHVDERRSAWSHVCAIARLAGAAVRSAADGSVEVAPLSAGTEERELRYGAELLAWYAERRADGEPAPAIVPTGAGSEAGAERWQLLLKEPDGGPPSATTLVPGAVRDRDAAATVADGFAARAGLRQQGGWALVTGLAGMRAGERVGLIGLPLGGDVGARALTVTHRLDRGGYTTRMTLGAAR